MINHLAIACHSNSPNQEISVLFPKWFPSSIGQINPINPHHYPTGHRLDYVRVQARTLAVIHLFNDPIALHFFNAAVIMSSYNHECHNYCSKYFGHKKSTKYLISRLPLFNTKHQVNLYLDKIWTLGSVFFSLGQFFCLSQDRLKHQCDLFRGVSQDEYPSLFPSTTCHIHQSAWVCKISRKITFISTMVLKTRTVYNWKSFQSPWRFGSNWRLCPGILPFSSFQEY